MGKFGYVRVSSKDQNIDRQLIALAPHDIPKRNLYVEKKSGKDFERPVYRRMLRRLRPGDLLILKSIDRLGRNYDEIISQWRILTKEMRVDILVLDMPLLNTTVAKDILGTFVADLVLQVLSYCAYAERENNLQRQAEGIAVAKTKGVRFGRPKKYLPDNFEELYTDWRNGAFSNEEMATRCNMALGVLYRKLREQGIEVRAMPRPQSAMK